MPTSTPIRVRPTNARATGDVVGDLAVEVDPAAVGLDRQRLGRLDAHFAHYVDGGLLPGWLILVTRGGRIAHLATYGDRDVEALSLIHI